RVIEQLGVEVLTAGQAEQSTQGDSLEARVVGDEGVALGDPRLDQAAHVALIEDEFDRAVLDGIGEHQDAEVWIGGVAVDVRLAQVDPAAGLEVEVYLHGVVLIGSGNTAPPPRGTENTEAGAL